LYWGKLQNENSVIAKKKNFSCLKAVILKIKKVYSAISSNRFEKLPNPDFYVKAFFIGST